MMTQMSTRSQVAAFSSVSSRPRVASRAPCRPVAALPSVQQVMKNAGGSMLAAAVAATLTFGAAPAEAKLTFGRKEDVAEQEAAYKDVLNRMEEAFEASQRAAAAAQKKASAAVDGVAGAASSVASAAKTSSQQVPL
mmetsp:Transcript_2747/g.8095  ORF Transcript_2747/g.8095 Transcript_2747/m.8095 type:complete len:137 (-) Transcript_2747:513-923(-)